MSAYSRREFLGSGAAALTAAAAPVSMTELPFLPLAELAALIRSKKVSPLELTRALLTRIERFQPKLNAFITVMAEQAIEQARELEAEQARGRIRGPLHGVPIGLKDLFDTAGVRTTAASAHFAQRVPAEDAEAVRRLKAAGSVLIGKLNMDEFAYSFTSETSHFGPVRNPWNPALTPGGSSGGSAAAVAAGLCYGALGSDTGGSIRLPAALCGVVGLKPTYGRVSTRGAVPLAWSLDHAGPMCRTVRDTAILLEAIAGYDPEDPNSVEAPAPRYAAALARKPPRLRLGVPRAVFQDGLDPEVAAAFEEARRVLGGLAAEIREVELPPLAMDERFPLPALGMLIRAEAYTWHARRLAETPEAYHAATRQTIESGASIPLASYIEARREMSRLRREVRNTFASVDLLITPSVPGPAFPLGAEEPPDLAYLRNAMAFNIYGLPALSMPCGFTRGGLPIGLQIAGPPFGEPALLALAHAYEQTAGWRGRHPEL